MESGTFAHNPRAAATPTENGVITNEVGFYKRPFTIVEKLSTTATAAVSLTKKVPARSVIEYAAVKRSTALTLSTAVKIGLGTASDPDSILLSSTTVTANTGFSGVPLTDNYYSAEQTIAIKAVDTNGAAAGTWAGDVYVLVSGWTYDDLPNT